MKLKAIEIIKTLDRWALPSLADDWDNTGFQIGDPKKDVERILVSLDLDKDAFQEALKVEAQMIVTHHPIIFKPLKSITRLDPKEELIYDIIREDMVVYNAHTNLDLAQGGVNDVLAKVLGLLDTEPLTIVNEDTGHGYGRVGMVDRVGVWEYLDRVKNVLDVEHLIVYGDGERVIDRVAVCGGSGASFIYDAYLKGADIYITGDIKYHEAQYAYELGLTLVDAGHYHTEKMILPTIRDYLEEELSNKAEIVVYDHSSPPYVVY
ncbi:MAG TPA: Nif3-like dinuclear metal center hexameric protein [Tepidimicrobium sp.]|nr:Nif3-like dinuclear metal center hexameric protein [Tepidimicrobium sp.]